MEEEKAVEDARSSPREVDEIGADDDDLSAMLDQLSKTVKEDRKVAEANLAATIELREQTMKTCEKLRLMEEMVLGLVVEVESAGAEECCFWGSPHQLDATAPPTCSLMTFCGFAS